MLTIDDPQIVVARYRKDKFVISVIVFVKHRNAKAIVNLQIISLGRFVRIRRAVF